MNEWYLSSYAMHSQLGLDSGWNRQGVSSFNMFQDLIVGQALEGKTSESNHLKEQDAV